MPTAFDGDDSQLVTVCVDHTLRIWNLKTGKILAETDLLGDDELGSQKYLIRANQRQLLQLVEMPGRQEYYTVTYSPKQHRFKFWAIFDAESGKDGMREMRPEINFTPPVDTMLDTAVWNLEEFYLRPSRGTKQTELWIRVRSGPSSHVFVLSFDPFDFPHKLHDVSSTFVRDSWAEDWVAVALGSQTVEALDEISPRDIPEVEQDLQVTAISERWLEFLFYPGRFTTPLLETALETYVTASGQSSSAPTKAPLKERLTKAVWASAVKPRHVDSQGVGLDAASCWGNFNGLVRDIYTRRTDSVSFAVDPWDQLPWLISSDFVGPVRICSDLELCDLNRDIADLVPNPKRVLYTRDQQADDGSSSEDEDVDDDALVGNIFVVAHAFRHSQTSSFQESFKRVVVADLMEESTSSITDRMHSLQEKFSLFSQNSEDDDARFDDLVNDHGGYPIFRTENFLQILRTLKEPEAGRHHDEQITRFGVKMLVRIAQETIALAIETLLDLLAIVLYLEGSFEPDELTAAVNTLPDDRDTMDLDHTSSSFDADGLFDKIMKLLRHNAVLSFLAANIRKERSRKRQKATGDSLIHRMAGSASSPEPIYSCTLLESMFIGDWADIRAPEDFSLPAWITYTSRAWLTKLDIDQFESLSAHVLSDLVKHGDRNLGDQFAAFVPLTGWTSYLRARLSLDGGDFDSAATWFRKAAFAMGMCG